MLFFNNYFKFEEDILDCVLNLLEKDTRVEKYPIKSFAQRNNPVWVARIISAIVSTS